MTQNAVVQTFGEPVYRTLYEAYFQELAAEALIRRWQAADTFMGILVAVTASGSAIAGWPLWSLSWGKFLWSAIAGVASLGALVHDRLQVPNQLKEWEELRRLFGELRFDLESLWLDMGGGNLNVAKAQERYDALRKRERELMSRTPSPFLLTKGLIATVQDELNETLKARGYAA